MSTSDAGDNRAVSALNPFPVVSREAQGLKYPPGVDTRFYWGDGRFSVVNEDLYDDAAGTVPLFKGITQIVAIANSVCFSGVDGELILDLDAGTISRSSGVAVIEASVASGAIVQLFPVRPSVP